MRRWVCGVLLMMSAADAAPLTGRLTDPAGRPLVGVPVWAAGQARPVPALPALDWVALVADSGPDGMFAFDLPTPLGATLPVTLLARVPGSGCAYACLAPPVTRADLRLVPSTALDGVVLNDRDRPLVGVTVWLADLGEWPEYARLTGELAGLWRTTTDRQGRWRLTDVPAEPARGVGLTAKGRARTRAAIGAGFQYAPASYARLAPEGVVRGRARLPDGGPAAGVALDVGGEIVRCDAEGRYEARHQPAPSSSIMPAEPWRGPWAREWVGLRTTAGQVVRAPEVTLLPGIAVAGRCVRCDQPRVGLFMTADRRTVPGQRYEIETDLNGEFGELMAPGTYTLAADGACTADGREFTALTVGPAGSPAPPVALHVPPPPGQQVRVTDEEGLPLRSLAVWARCRLDVCQDDTDDDGRFDLPLGLAAEAADWTVFTPSPWRRGQITVPAGAEPRLLALTLPLSASGPLRGRVFDERHCPLPGARVALRLWAVGEDAYYAGGPPEAMVVTTDAQGVFRFEAVPVDWRGELRVSHADCWPAPPLVLGPLGQQPELAARLERADQRVGGMVVDAAGQPVPGAVVFAEGYLLGPPAVSAADGSFVCPRLPARPVSLVALVGRRTIGWAQCRPPVEGLRLVVDELPPTVWAERARPVDRALARDLLLAAAETTAGHGDSLALLARADAHAAVNLLLGRVNDEGYSSVALDMLRQVPAEVAFDERVLRVVQAISWPADRIEAAWHAGRHVPADRRDALRALLAEADQARPTGYGAFRAAVCRTQLALRAAAPDADQRLRDLARLARGDGAEELRIDGEFDATLSDPRVIAVLRAAGHTPHPRPAPPADRDRPPTALARSARGGVEAERVVAEVLAEAAFDTGQSWDVAQPPTMSHWRGLEPASQLVLVEPNRARWALESLGAALAAAGEDRRELIVAMAGVDPTRAAEMVATKEERAGLARWLLAGRAARCSQRLGVWGVWTMNESWY